MRPRVGSIRRSIVRPSVLLPQPLSPTNPNVSLAAIERETSETACTTRVAPNQPDETSNWRTSPSTRINGTLDEPSAELEFDSIAPSRSSRLVRLGGTEPLHLMMLVRSVGSGNVPSARRANSPCLVLFRRTD